MLMKESTKEDRDFIMKTIYIQLNKFRYGGPEARMITDKDGTIAVKLRATIVGKFKIGTTIKIKEKDKVLIKEEIIGKTTIFLLEYRCRKINAGLPYK